MTEFIYDESKEKWLLANRGFSFRLVISKLENGEVEDIIPNPNQKKHGGSEAFVIDIDGYKCVVPFIDKGNYVILKTIYRDRKINRRYQNGSKKSPHKS